MASQAFFPIGTEMQRAPLTGGTPGTYVTIAEVLKVTRSGSKAEIIDVSNFDSPSRFKEKLPGMLDSGDCDFDCNLIPGDATQASLLADFNGQVLSAYKIELPGGTLGNWTFNAYVASDDFTLDLSKQATKAVKLVITGPVTFTAGS